MKLTKKQTDELFNCHEGVGFLAMKTNHNEVTKIEFYVTQKGEIRYIADYMQGLDLNDFVKTRGK